LKNAGDTTCSKATGTTAAIISGWISFKSNARLNFQAGFFLNHTCHISIDPTCLDDQKASENLNNFKLLDCCVTIITAHLSVPITGESAPDEFGCPSLRNSLRDFGITGINSARSNATQIGYGTEVANRFTEASARHGDFCHTQSTGCKS